MGEYFISKTDHGLHPGAIHAPGEEKKLATRPENPKPFFGHHVHRRIETGFGGPLGLRMIKDDRLLVGIVF